MLAISSQEYATSGMSFDDFAQPYFDKGIGCFECTSNFLPSATLMKRGCQVSNITTEITNLTQRQPALCGMSSEQQQALDLLENIVKLATHYKTRNVIVFPGFIDMGDVLLLQKQQQDLLSSPDSQNLQELLKKRRYLTEKSLDNLCRALYQLLKKFPEMYFCFLPARFLFDLFLFPEELQWVIEDLQSPNVGYWHSTSRCYLQQKIGAAKPEAWLTIHGKNLFGTHLEDVIDGRGMYPPGIGEVSFTELASLLPKNCIKIIRCSQSFGMMGTENALEHLRGNKVIP